MSFNDVMKEVKGNIRECINAFRGVQATYTLFTDLATTPPTKVVLTIFIRPTPTENVRRREFGTSILETLDAFIVSRDALQSPIGTFHRPTSRDHFTLVGDPKAIRYKVKDINEPDEYESHYELIVHGERSKYAKG